MKSVFAIAAALVCFSAHADLDLHEDKPWMQGGGGIRKGATLSAADKAFAKLAEASAACDPKNVNSSICDKSKINGKASESDVQKVSDLVKIYKNRGYVHAVAELTHDSVQEQIQNERRFQQLLRLSAKDARTYAAALARVRVAVETQQQLDDKLLPKGKVAVETQQQLDDKFIIRPVQTSDASGAAR